MTNFIISIFYLIITFSITFLFFRKCGKYGLYIWLCVLVIISNIQTIKMSEFFNLVTSLGNISYGAIFLTTDILSEKYGCAATIKGTIMSFIIMIIFAFLMVLFLNYIPAECDSSQSSLEIVFGYIPRITCASICAYLISQLIDTHLYCYLKKKFNKVYISNNLSTLVSQFFDTIFFVFISFLGVYSFSEIIELILTMILFKVMIAILDTPFMLLATKYEGGKL